MLTSCSEEERERARCTVAFNEDEGVEWCTFSEKDLRAQDGCISSIATSLLFCLLEAGALSYEVGRAVCGILLG